MCRGPVIVTRKRVTSTTEGVASPASATTSADAGRAWFYDTDDLVCEDRASKESREDAAVEGMRNTGIEQALGEGSGGKKQTSSLLGLGLGIGH